MDYFDAHTRKYFENRGEFSSTNDESFEKHLAKLYEKNKLISETTMKSPFNLAFNLPTWYGTDNYFWRKNIA